MPVRPVLLAVLLVLMGLLVEFIRLALLLGLLLRIARLVNACLLYTSRCV